MYDFLVLNTAWNTAEYFDRCDPIRYGETLLESIGILSDRKWMETFAYRESDGEHEMKNQTLGWRVK